MRLFVLYLMITESQLKVEVNELFTVGEQVDQGELQLPDDLVIADEIAIRQERLENLAKAKKVLEARAQERYAAEKAENDAKLCEREEKCGQNHRKSRGRTPKAPEPGPDDKDQSNFTDPDSRITPAPNRRCGVKNSTNTGVAQHYNIQVANDQESLLIVAHSLSNHPNDKQQAIPTLSAISPEVGKPQAVAMDNGYFSQTNINACEELGIHPFIATGREPHHLDWHTFSKNNLSRLLKMSTQRSKWLTNSKPKSDKPFTAYASLR